jgi:hypothetical protein
MPIFNSAPAQEDIAIVNTSHLKLDQLIYQYKITGMKLHAISDVVPETEFEEDSLNKRETFLMDRQADLLESAMTSEIKTLDDAKAILGLWRHEVIECQSPDSLSASDVLIDSVCRFLNVE